MSQDEQEIVLKMSEFKSIQKDVLILKNDKYGLETTNKKLEIGLIFGFSFILY